MKKLILLLLIGMIGCLPVRKETQNNIGYRYVSVLKGYEKKKNGRYEFYFETKSGKRDTINSYYRGIRHKFIGYKYMIYADTVQMTAFAKKLN